jgi:dTDP-4-dehydrorhamnose 3,5-epimerase
MKISDTILPGCKLVEPSPLRDDRGHFMRLFDAEVFAAHGMTTHLAQASLSFNTARGTLRGLHFQAHPGMEDKLVRCGRGSVFDVAVDIRPGSPTFGRWVGFELSEAQALQLYIPAGFAHGFQTLTDDAVVLYQISVPYEAPLSAGVRFDDAELGIDWPLPPLNLSPRDRMLPSFKDLDRAKLMPFESSLQ